MQPLATVTDHEKYLLFCLLFPISFYALAETIIYKEVGDDGEIIFSDVKPATGDAEELIVQDPATINSEGDVTTIKKSLPKKKTKKYKLDITAPAADQTFANVQQVNVAITVTPAIEDDLEIVAMLNGKKVHSGSNSFSVAVVRGSHTLQAMLVDQRGKKVVQAKPVTFHVRQFSRLHKKPGAN